MTKIGRNSPCWCGSGRKYKKCHYIRADEIAYSIGRRIAELRSKTAHKECLHPDAGIGQCSKKIIDAHSIQKSGPLKHIVDESNHVYAFGTNANGNAEISKIGWQQASTFKGFCGIHDKEMFSPIEDENYSGERFQSFLAGYRAYALEYFKKVSAVKGLPFMKENLDKGMSHEEQIALQRRLEIMNQGYMKGIDEMKATLDIYINHYNQKNFDAFNEASFYFTGDLSVVSSGAFFPEFTMAGERLQSLAIDTFAENISINTLKTAHGYAIVFSWPRTFTKCTRFAQSLTEIDHELLPSRLIELIFSYIENSYFSKSWIYSLNDEKRLQIEKMARNPIQYSKPVIFTNFQYTNWKIDRVVLN